MLRSGTRDIESEQRGDRGANAFGVESIRFSPIQSDVMTPCRLGLVLHCRRSISGFSMHHRRCAGEYIAENLQFLGRRIAGFVVRDPRGLPKARERNETIDAQVEVPSSRLGRRPRVNFSRNLIRGLVRTSWDVGLVW